ncbi:alpha-glucosidase [Harpegnathos saltator]|uniref:alpha-glucosidase n=1 Tax=Harpegnathos saltator TaxID=610380 RepID=E2BQW5_HARSA|nr:alpha-glucosidase [Harpegnathos saltator]XP_011143533.1 alpha-glucosidase [Harpegnathos saltator]EFN81919.1 Maltase 1 [Harpegnathos saltator]
MLVVTRYVALISALLLFTTAVDGALARKEWWKTTLVYQIWPRGFQDSDGDGEGDLKGIAIRLDYIEDLKVQTICLSPIYPSPLIDSGYDISNYTDVHPLFGDLDDFDVLVRESHNRGLKVILDIVPNHSSDQHEWFQLSARNVEPYSDYYIWANGDTDDDGNNIPPTNWLSTYSDKDGSAWTWHDGRRQWYYHKFHSSQPDLNLRNERVIEELMNIFDFWLKRNVDGFRINAVPYFFEDEYLRDEPAAGKGAHTFGLSESTALLYRFREHINNWSTNNGTWKFLIAESYDSDANLITYYGNDTHEGIAPFNYKFITHVRNNSDANHIKNILDSWLNLLPRNTSTNWVLSNHDNSRAASRIGLNRVDGLHMLSLLLPGQAYTYYGEEIAMLDAKVPWNRTIDPMGCFRGEKEFERFSRDPARTPMQWNSAKSAGFTMNDTTYLPVHPNYIYRNVEAQLAAKRSNLLTYKRLATLRKLPIFVNGDYEFATLNNKRVLVLKRSLENYPAYIVVINLGIRQERVNLTSIYPDLNAVLRTVVESSNALHVTITVPRDNFILTANAALVLSDDEKKETSEPATSSTPTSNVSDEDPSTIKSTVTTEGAISSSDDTAKKKTSTSSSDHVTPKTGSGTTKKPNDAALYHPSVLNVMINLAISVIGITQILAVT